MEDEAVLIGESPVKQYFAFAQGFSMSCLLACVGTERSGLIELVRSLKG